MLGVLAEVKVAAVGDALQFRPPHREEVVNVIAVQGVVGQFVLHMLAQLKVFFPDAQFEVPVKALLEPVVKPFLVCSRLNKELDFHLLELPAAEDKVAGGNLVAEGLAYLGNTEGQLLPGGGNHVLEVDEDTLGGLRTQVDDIGGCLNRAHKGLEHQVEHLRFGEFSATIRAVLTLELVSTPSLVAAFTLGKGVGEPFQVPAGLPGPGVHQDARIDTDHIVPLLDHRPPPGVFDVPLQLHPQRAIVPAAGQASVDFTAGEDEAAPAAE